MGFSATTTLLRLYPALAGIALTCMVTDATFAAPIEFSSPQSGVTVSNLNQLRAKQSGQKQLEEDLSRPFESLSPGNSLGPVFTAPYRPLVHPRIPTKQDKEQEDLHKNWIFMNTDDLGKQPSAEKIFGLKDYDKNGEEKKPRTAAEKYYQNLERKRGAANEGTDDPGMNEDKNAFKSFRSTDRLDILGENADKPDQLLRGVLNSQLDSKLGDSSISLSGLPFSDPGKSGGFQTDRDTARAHVDIFRKLVDTSSTSTPDSLNSLNQPIDIGRSSLTPANGLGVYTIPTPRDFSSPALGALQDLNTRALGQSSWTPAVQPSQLLKVQPATLTIPKRKF